MRASTRTRTGRRANAAGRTTRLTVAAGMSVLMVAAACGGDDGGSVAVDGGTPPAPAAATEPSPADPQPAPAAAPSDDAASSPAESAAAPPAPSEPAAVDPPAPPADAPEISGGGEAGGAGGSLDPEQALRTALAVHEAATSVEYEVLLTMEMGFAGATMVSIDDAFLGVVRIVGPLTWTQYDMAAIAGLAGPASPGAELPLLEFVRNSETGEFYTKLEPLLADAPPEEVPPWVTEAVADSGGDIGDLWLDAAAPGVSEQVPVLFGLPEAPDLAEFLQLAEAAADDGAVTEQQHLGSGEVSGVPVESYRFVLDVTQVSDDVPDFVGSLLGDGEPTEGEPTEGAEELAAMLAQLPAPLEAHLRMAVGAGGEARRLELEMDLAPLMAGLLGAFGDMAGDAGDMPDVEWRIGTRLDITAVNDPTLTVPLPDPANVIAPR
ncbi:MAG: hypothetical protein F4078_02335 [Acidimicrobiia bacterium]|nr:hypothetical protein [Acidimicrobiia bacterium]MYJ13150.1 hypothetical protein [Acidimicrobiia bacterium]